MAWSRPGRAERLDIARTSRCLEILTSLRGFPSIPTDSVVRTSPLGWRTFFEVPVISRLKCLAAFRRKSNIDRSGLAAGPCQ